MSIFKKIFKKKKIEAKKVEECWYNNEHEKVHKLSLVPVVEDSALASPNAPYYSTSRANQNH